MLNTLHMSVSILLKQSLASAHFFEGIKHSKMARLTEIVCKDIGVKKV